MSLTPVKSKTGSGGFPRVSGDEPAAFADWQRENGFSPRERG